MKLHNVRPKRRPFTDNLIDGCIGFDLIKTSADFLISLLSKARYHCLNPIKSTEYFIHFGSKQHPSNSRILFGKVNALVNYHFADLL